MLLFFFFGLIFMILHPLTSLLSVMETQGLSRLYYPECLQLYTMIDLSGNTLSQLPGEVRYLVCLRTLLLDNNRLDGLPEEIGQLTTLEVLSIKNNRILTYKFPLWWDWDVINRCTRRCCRASESVCLVLV